MVIGGGIYGFVTTVLVNAAIGAAIGGLTAVVTNGDVGAGVLYGAIGGAVSGALAFGASAISSSLALPTTAANTSKEGLTGLSHALSKGEAVSQNVAGVSDAVSASANVAESGGFWNTVSNGWSSFKDSVGNFFSSGEGGEALAGAMDKGAVSSGLKSIADIYMQGRATKSAEKQAQQMREHELKKLGMQLASNEKIAATRGGGGGGGGGMSLSDRLALERAQRETVLAKVDREMEGHRSLKEQEFQEMAAARGRASDAAKSLHQTGRTALSRSEESLADIQDRIREGESVQGQPNTGVVPPVEYKPETALS